MSSHPCYSNLQSSLYHQLFRPDCFLQTCDSSIPIPANEILLKAHSPFIAALMNTPQFAENRTIHLDLKVANASIALQKAMDLLTTGESELEGCSSQQLHSVAEQCQFLSLKDSLDSHKIIKPQPKPIGSIFPFTPSIPTYNPAIFANQLLLSQIQQTIYNNCIQQLMANQLQQASQQINVESIDERVPKKRRAGPDGREMKKSHSLDCDEPFDNMGDVIIPSNDKEGWCRNKKYIEKTDAGFMCTVCKKIYGRYNSVSYHVTIYHRNPPIKCDLAGCQFTTREARYIHFHKYYRHGVALPASIDQGSRRCPFCRHVSKSPAMLEKHIKRHQTSEGIKEEQSELHVEDIVVDEPTTERDRTDSQSSTSSSIMECGGAEDDDDPPTKPRAFTL